MTVSRRFLFSLSVNPGLPRSFVDHFARPGRYSFEAAFSQRARRYRRSKRIVVAMLAGFLLGLVAALKLPVPEGARLWIVLPSAALIPLALLLHLLTSRLRCPACRKALTPAKGGYCPLCGSERYLAGSQQCEDCGCRIEEETAEDGRSYRVRGCTHCGVFLDDRGL